LVTSHISELSSVSSSYNSQLASSLGAYTASAIAFDLTNIGSLHLTPC